MFLIYGAVTRKIQCTVCRIVAACLVRALRFLSWRDSHIQAEAKAWPSEKRLRLETPDGTAFTIVGTQDGFVSLTSAADADVIIRFKSPADAFRVFTGQISVAQAYAQHRFVLKGDMSLAMPFVRCVDRAEGYLFPKFMARRILKRLPQKEVAVPRVYAAALFGR